MSLLMFFSWHNPKEKDESEWSACVCTAAEDSSTRPLGPSVNNWVQLFYLFGYKVVANFQAQNYVIALINFL